MVGNTEDSLHVSRSENLLKKAGGAVVASQVEKDIRRILHPDRNQGNQGNLLSKDSTYTAKTWFVEVLGKFRVDEKGRSLHELPARSGQCEGISDPVAFGTETVVDADGFLQMMKTASMFTKIINSVEVLAAMADLYDGMLLDLTWN